MQQPECTFTCTNRRTAAAQSPSLVPECRLWRNCAQPCDYLRQIRITLSTCLFTSNEKKFHAYNVEFSSRCNVARHSNLMINSLVSLVLQGRGILALRSIGCDISGVLKTAFHCLRHQCVRGFLVIAVHRFHTNMKQCILRSPSVITAFSFPLSLGGRDESTVSPASQLPAATAEHIGVVDCCGYGTRHGTF